MKSKDLRVGDRVIFRKRCRKVIDVGNDHFGDVVILTFADWPKMVVRPGRVFQAPRDYGDLPLLKELPPVS